ncbi:hypothetical protein [Flavobacterium psychrophilum]|uniref:hypothetical protein n=1 Tax=Flavobacterium psychrophilum TaxID=96345 RepID=UPI00090C71AD|nr:hypothetical protein [Flavobacterium psychrophilum]EKT2072611.1 hypothetical protein [Flavobacterium psychrophilum]EKT4492124.1 hypothetical protein [Flavobacterium psychrophilum]SHH93171.1 Probable lipoprotein precursor [Flavobacterium psychrophilum]
MKKSVSKFGLFSMILLGMVSCKNKERELADKRISELENYVDSLKTVSAEDREANWDIISQDFETKNANAKAALTSIDQDSKAKSQEKIDASNATYDEYKVIVSTKLEEEQTPEDVVKPVKTSPSQLLRDRLFGAGKVGTDMSFTWVNKDNILKVYDNFFQSYKQNKSNFTREDYDEIKLMYEALDSRKNTVEKEGLSSEDNGKIASIKLKFAPMFKVNRMGAKSRENQEAKE